MRRIIGYDSDGNPIYGAEFDDTGTALPFVNIPTPKKETGKSFDDAIKDLYWDVLGREPDAAGLEAYKKQFGKQISPEEEQEFYRTAKEELRNRGEGAGDPLYKLYAQNLGRAPTIEEYRKSREQFGGDVSGRRRATVLRARGSSRSAPKTRPYLSTLSRRAWQNAGCWLVIVTTKKSLISPPTLLTECVKIF
jgi:hypothetical protein